MPTISDFLTDFGWPEFLFTLIIALTIVAIHEWRNVLRLFTDGKKEKNIRTEE